MQFEGPMDMHCRLAEKAAVLAPRLLPKLRIGTQKVGYGLDAILTAVHNLPYDMDSRFRARVRNRVR